MAKSLKKLKELVADICDVDIKKIVDGGKLVGYGLDSVRVLDLIMALEDEYAIEIDETDPELAEVTTIIELSELVDRRIESK